MSQKRKIIEGKLRDTRSPHVSPVTVAVDLRQSSTGKWDGYICKNNENQVSTGVKNGFSRTVTLADIHHFVFLSEEGGFEVRASGLNDALGLFFSLPSTTFGNERAMAEK